ncbi:MAG: hypothetical protein KF850_18490 [Labilithrix sp.]|nr:hypothetical protein [Labilithrix sp.]
MRLIVSFGVASVLVLGALVACSSGEEGGAAPPGADADAGGGGGGDAAASDAPSGEGGPGAGDVRFFESGTRVKVQSFRVDEGEYFRTFIDTDLGEPCTLRAIGDGSTAVCLPATASIAYSDPSCTTLVGKVSGEPAGYAIGPTETDACGIAKDITLYPIGAAIDTALIYVRDGADCLEQLADGGTVRALGAPLTVASGGIATFVAKREPASSALERVRWVSSDGAAVVVSSPYVDVGAQRECSATDVGAPGATGRRRCVPAKQAIHMGPALPGTGGPFTDGTCATPAARTALAPACAAPDIVLRRRTVVPAVGCAESYFTLAEVGSQITGTYSGSPGNCTTFTPPRTTMWSLGAEIPITTFPEIEDVLVGVGRVRAKIARSNGSTLSQVGAFDTAADALCSPTKIGDEWFCTSTFDPSPWCGFDYADSACTTPILLRNACDVRPQAVVLGTDQGGGFCAGPGAAEVRPVLPAPLALTQYYVKDGEVCHGPLDVPSRAYGIGDATPPASVFSKVTFAIE